ncbi:MAG: ASKHA domain-containing protein [Clostridiales bacterium]|nr:ASKHA domain-containing protein [Roseburia sp.]MDD7638512.1 ASKHA domain-containing protein [Clostridiales bacterium]MDY4112450.1 ASKHA domain-containing protein [Roseburia sp.]
MIEILTAGKNEKVYISDLSGEKSLLALMQEQKIYTIAPCNGKGECGRCRVRFLFGAPVPTEKERRLLAREELESGIRLACAVHVTESCRIFLGESGEENMAALTEKQEQSKMSLNQSGNDSYGIAIDIGTTTLAAELFSLSDGRTISIASGVNHQRAYGADVISRISAANEGKGGLLQESIRADIVRLTKELLRDAIAFEDVKQIAVVGNTTMCHLLRGLSCEKLGCAPFVPTDNSLYETDAMQLLGVEGWGAKVTILPGISAFVGADIVAGIYASGMDIKEEAGLLLDIGTNGEMVLGYDGGLLVTSAAAGPVFEGGNVSCGMPGIPGAICHATLCGTDWNCEMIDGKPPVGICGTGIIDIVSELVKAGRVDENGTIEEPWFTDGITVTGKVSFNQKDIREVQMGKAAIRAGIETLMAEYAKATDTQGKENENLTVYLAGGFGHYMDIAKAIHIGMFPGTFAGCTECIGNCALEGAKRYLLSEKDARNRIARIIARAKEINLAEQPIFQELYVTQMFF